MLYYTQAAYRKITKSQADLYKHKKTNFLNNKYILLRLKMGFPADNFDQFFDLWTHLIDHFSNFQANRTIKSLDF